MATDLSTVVDFASALALLSLLASSYGWLRRTILSAWLSQVILGALFGVVAILQMNLPVQPIPGIAIDLRAIPVVLAGAFLGWRGAAVCVAMAVAMRLHLGGVGAPAGAAAVVLTAVLGLAWAWLTRNDVRKRPLALVALGVATAGNMVTVVVLPPDIAAWFLANATPPLTVAYVVLVPLFALLMQREDASIWIERQLRASASTDPVTGLLTAEAFARAAASLAADGSPGLGTGLAVFRIRHASWIRQVHGHAALDTVRSATRARLADALGRDDVLGQTPSGLIVALLPDRDDATTTMLSEAVARSLSSRPIRLEDGGQLRVSLDMGSAWSADVPPLSELLTDASGELERNGRSGGVDATVGHEAGDRGLRDVLFARAARLQS